jgi:hypothetical protein
MTVTNVIKFAYSAPMSNYACVGYEIHCDNSTGFKVYLGCDPRPKAPYKIGDRLSDTHNSSTGFIL